MVGGKNRLLVLRQMENLNLQRVVPTTFLRRRIGRNPHRYLRIKIATDMYDASIRDPYDLLTQCEVDAPIAASRAEARIHAHLRAIQIELL